MVSQHLPYTIDQIVKNLALLEEHFKDYACPDCINKHLILIEGYAEEGMTMTNDEKWRLLLVKCADMCRAVRKELTMTQGHKDTPRKGCKTCGR